MEFYTSVRRTKYKWTLLWCTILYQVLIINVVNSTILLEKQHYVRYGEALNITCSTNNPLSSAENLTFSVNNITKPSVVVNRTTIQLYEDKPRKQNTKYYCTDAADNQKGVCEVLVDAAPRARAFHCESRDRRDLACRWSAPPGPSRLRTRTRLTFLGPYGDDLKECQITTLENGLQSCLWNRTTRPAYRPDYKKYTFKLTCWNEFDSSTQLFPVEHCAVVRPAPPLRLAAAPRAHEATLQWGVSKNLLNFCDVYHNIEFQYRVGDSTVKETLNTSMLKTHSNTNEYSYDLNLPYAHMMYEVRIAIQTTKNREANETELWSDFSEIKFWSESERPHRPPVVPAGAFYVAAAYPARRHLQVYWGQLQPQEQCGDQFLYRVQAPGARSPADLAVTRLPLDLPYAPNTPLDILVASENSVGSSNESSRLYIAAQSSLLEGPYSFTKNSYPNGTHELLWDFDQPAESVDNYTLFWCIDNQTHVCLDQVHFVTVNSSVRSYSLRLPSERRYQFALSSNRGPHSSGMVWTTCDLSKHDLRIIPNVTVLNFGRTQYTVEFTWKLQCLLKDIVQYKVTFCEVNDKTDSCEDHSVLISTRDPQDRLINIDLSYNIKNRFSITLLTETGPIETIRDNVKDVLYPSYNHDSVITGIIIFIISFVLMCWLIVNCYKRHKVTNDIKVILPADLQLNQHYIIRNDKPSWLPIHALEPFDWLIFKDHATNIRASHVHPDVADIKSDTVKSSDDSVQSLSDDEVVDSSYLIDASQPTVECAKSPDREEDVSTPYVKSSSDSNPAYVVARPCVSSSIGYVPHLAYNQCKTNTNVGKTFCDGIQEKVSYDIFPDAIKGIGDESASPLLPGKTEADDDRDAYVKASPAVRPSNGYVQFKTELKF
ncbi:cytokine receptor-like [Plutella xylostella]|uniref:cytokine receptor-like n=1 Tax=Plutella xylostella TaxID=51655 RepID=UPI0020330750|nr:cytokine receptor-like [Plutella xylostella]